MMSAAAGTAATAAAGRRRGGGRAGIGNGEVRFRRAGGGRARAEVLSRAVPGELTMLIDSGVQDELSTAPVTPLMVAEALLNFAVPKLARGRMPLFEDGALAIHSALELATRRRSG